MAPVSERKRLLNDLDTIVFNLAIQKKTLARKKQIRSILGIKALLLSFRYMQVRVTIPKSPEYRNQILDLLNAQFQLLARMSKRSFKSLEQLIRHNSVFANISPNPQRAVWIQMLVALERLGCDGNGVSVGRVALTFGVSVGYIV